MRKTLFLLFVLGCLLFVPCSASAQYRNTGNYVTIRLTPDRADWTYRCKSDVRLELQVIRHNVAIPNVTIGYTWGYEQRPALTKDSLRIDKTGKTTLTLHGADVPGFMTFTANVRIDGEQYTNYINLAFDPLRIQPTTTLPEDFMSWWQAELKKAEQVPLMPVFKHEPGMSNGKADVYMVHFQNHKAGSYIYGMLTVPKTPGKHAAVVEYPGAGIHKFQSGNMAWADSDIVCLQIGIHGIPVTMEQYIYDNLHNGALNGYWNFGMDNRDESYYKHVVIGCIRALDYIAEYTPWNNKEMGVTGSSQGGFLTLATAALDKRITYYAPVHAALCDHTNSLRGVACGWPHYFYWNKGKGMEKNIECSRYYDGVNFARLITNEQQGWFSFGYNDDVVPPTTAWATYNVVTGPKQISPYQATWHFWHQEQWDEWEDWLLKQMNIK